MATSSRLGFSGISGTLAVAFGLMLCVMSSDLPAQAKKKKKEAAEAVELDPWYRPDGSIVDKPARYYIWYDGTTWFVRACSQQVRAFHGTLRVANGKIKSCVPIGLKENTKKDSWSVSENRTLLTFNFEVSTKSDGLDLKIEGDDATLEFDLAIGKLKKQGT